MELWNIFMKTKTNRLKCVIIGVCHTKNSQKAGGQQNEEAVDFISNNGTTK